MFSTALSSALDELIYLLLDSITPLSPLLPMHEFNCDLLLETEHQAPSALDLCQLFPDSIFRGFFLACI